MAQLISVMTGATQSPATAALDIRPSLAGLSRSQLAAVLVDIGVPKAEVRMRLAQLWQWIYVHGATDFDRMDNISKRLRGRLGADYCLRRPLIQTEQISADGTRKWLLQLDGGAEIECVYIPESDRGTLCVSSQVGCTLTCSFCYTGTQKLVRNLTAQEIVQQVLVARDRIGDFPGRRPEDSSLLPRGGARYVSNVVFMGMGEPLYNFDNVRDAISILADGDGLSLSKRRITVSTSGVVPQISRLGAEVGSMLAVSLHAVRDELRNILVPLNKKYPIATLLDACRHYPGASNSRRITFEYVMLQGLNDQLADARALVRLLKGIPAKINLIPFNPWPGTTYECSPWDRIEAFSEIVFNAGYASPVRTPRGRDILAACGQLKSATEKLRARTRMLLEQSLILGED
jgi:23S rRNA (adenine2503-C2)-methyltransferase